MSSKTIYTFPTSKKHLYLLTQEEKNQIFINKAKLKHGDKYDYSLVNYTKATEKVKIICPVEGHGVFEQVAFKHANVGSGCQLCAGNMKSSAYEFIKKARKKYGNKFNYDFVVYTVNWEKVIIVCPLHGKFKQTPTLHLSGKHGCPSCGDLSTGLIKTKNTEEVIKNFNLIHNGVYDYSLVEYLSATTKVKIFCSNHGIFEQTPNGHLAGKGCRKCTKQISNPSKEWLDSLNIPNLIREYEIPEHKYMPVDGYDPSTNTIYQFHGSYWHSDPRIFTPDTTHPVKRHKDKSKMTHGENYNNSNIKDFQLLCWRYNLIVMWEYDWNIIKKAI